VSTNIFVEPLNAVADALLALDEGLSVAETIDVMASRIAQGVAAPRRGATSDPTALTAEDLATVTNVERALSNGLDLVDWFENARAGNGFSDVFTIERTFNRPGSSYGFFGEADLREQGLTPVMGNFQRMFYDAPRVPAELRGPAADWLRRQMREFVLRYFMRVSDFRMPEPYRDEPPHSPPRWLTPLSWCPDDRYEPRGFGFSQLYYKRRDGVVGKFSEDEQFAIVDLREACALYEWIVLRVRIFDFAVRVRPFGNDGPELTFGLNEESLLVLTPDFVVDQTEPGGKGGEYGIGYAFMRNQGKGLIAYGPGQFDAAFETIRFIVSEHGETYVDMIFVANRPTEIANVVLDPIDWGFRIADWAFSGLPSRVFAPVKALFTAFPLHLGQFDPVYAYITATNALTFGLAGERLCITREELDKRFIVQHFMQHYNAVSGSLLTWRQIPDWLDEPALPDWVVNGVSL